MNREELEDIVGQIYRYCNNNDPEGLYPVEVDLYEFAEKLLAVVEARSRNQRPD